MLHRPDARLTCRSATARRWRGGSALPVAYDFRAADVAAGGQGAPLVPVFHQALARDLDRPHPIAVLNVGGVANVTFVDGGDPVACDTGPGNALIDDFMRARTGAPLDRDGDQAAQGRADEAFVARVLAHRLFRSAVARNRSTATPSPSPISGCRIFRWRTARRPCRR